MTWDRVLHESLKNWSRLKEKLEVFELAERLYFEDVSSVLELIDDVKPEFDYHATRPTEHIGYEVHFTETVWFRGAKAGVMWVTIPLKDYDSEEEIAEEARKALQEKEKELLEEERRERRRRRQEGKIERDGREKTDELNDLIGAQPRAGER